MPNYKDLEEVDEKTLKYGIAVRIVAAILFAITGLLWWLL